MNYTYVNKAILIALVSSLILWGCEAMSPNKATEVSVKSILTISGQVDDFQKRGWISNETEDKLHLLQQILSKNPEPSIIYVTNRKSCLETVHQLESHGFKATYYHGGLTSKDKDRHMKLWMDEKVQVIVATNADYVKFYIDEQFIGSFYPSKEYESLPHPPIVIDDFIGQAIHDNEPYSAKDCDKIKDEYCITKNIRLLRISYKEINKIDDILKDNNIGFF